MTLHNELAAQRKVTHGFIMTQPVTVTLRKRVKVKQPAGGFAWEDDYERDPQVMRVVEPSGQPQPVVTADGVDRVIEFMLLAEWDAEIERGDVFELQGKAFEVVELFWENGYERRAMVSGRG